MKYIKVTNETTEEDLQQQYRAWAKKLHPDLGGTEQEFNQLQDEMSKARSMINHSDFKGLDIKDIKDIAFKAAKKHFSTMLEGLLDELGTELKKRL